MAEYAETPAKQVASDFVSQYTDEDLFWILQMNPSQLKEYILQVAESNLEYAISILPGRPSRPTKPQVG